MWMKLRSSQTCCLIFVRERRLIYKPVISLHGLLVEWLLFTTTGTSNNHHGDVFDIHPSFAQVVCWKLAAHHHHANVETCGVGMFLCQVTSEQMDGVSLWWQALPSKRVDDSQTKHSLRHRALFDPRSTLIFRFEPNPCKQVPVSLHYLEFPLERPQIPNVTACCPRCGSGGSVLKCGPGQNPVEAASCVKRWKWIQHLDFWLKKN